MNFLDPVKNNVNVTVSTTYDAVATSIVLASGEGAKLPDPSTDGEFNLVWYDSTTYPDPNDDPNVEIVRVTAVSTDTLTVTRNQEGSGASTKNTASVTYKMGLFPTKKLVDDIDDVVGSGLIPIKSTLTYSSWDSTVRTAVFTTSADETGNTQIGDRIKFTQPTDGVKWGIVTAITSGTITLFINSDYDVDNEAVSSPYYSHAKNPYGFDPDPEKWTLKITDTTDYSQSSPTQNTWYEFFTFSAPIGKWAIKFNGEIYGISSAGQTAADVWITIADSTASAGDDETVSRSYVGGASGSIVAVNSFSKMYFDSFSSKTTQYVNCKTSLVNMDTIHLDGATITTFIELVCAYL